jgi:hypothetical protein
MIGNGENTMKVRHQRASDNYICTVSIGASSEAETAAMREEVLTYNEFMGTNLRICRRGRFGPNNPASHRHARHTLVKDAVRFDLYLYDRDGYKYGYYEPSKITQEFVEALFDL